MFAHFNLICYYQTKLVFIFNFHPKFLENIEWNICKINILVANKFYM